MGTLHPTLLLFTISVISLALQSFCHDGSSTLKPGHVLRDWEQLVSEGGVFKLGFFTPPKASSFELGTGAPRYIGVWPAIPYHTIWVGNPRTPVVDSSGVLIIGGDGLLKITRVQGPPIVLNPGTRVPPGGNASAALLDTGNFVVRVMGRGGMPGRVLWQSFDYPSDRLLPGMKLGFNVRTGRDQAVASWTSEKVPTPGAFELGVDPTGADQLVVTRRGEVYWSSGVLRDGIFPNVSLELSKEYLDYEFKFGHDKDRKYFTYNIKNNVNNSVLCWWELDTFGQLTVFNYVPDKYGTSHQIFETLNYCATDLKNSTSICISEKKVKCRKSSEFFRVRRGYMGTTSYGDYNTSLGVSDCHGRCWKNCSCIAFQAAFTDDTGCQFWGKDAEFYEEESVGNLVYLLTSEKN